MVEISNGFRLDRIAFLSPGAADLSLSGGEPKEGAEKAALVEGHDSGAVDREAGSDSLAASTDQSPLGSARRADAGDQREDRDVGGHDASGQQRDEAGVPTPDASPVAERAELPQGAAAQSASPIQGLTPASQDKGQSDSAALGHPHASDLTLGTPLHGQVDLNGAVGDLTGIAVGVSPPSVVGEVAPGLGPISLEPVTELVSPGTGTTTVHVETDPGGILPQTPIQTLDDTGLATDVTVPVSTVAASDVDEDIGQILEAMAIASPPSDYGVPSNSSEPHDAGVADFGPVEPGVVTAVTDTHEIDHHDVDGLGL
jgi:hypothetical protein